jgi:hypothetical protein
MTATRTRGRVPVWRCAQAVATVVVAVVVEPPHFATGLGTLELQLGRKLLLGRRFTHAGVGYSTTSFGPGLDRRILDPSVPGTCYRRRLRRRHRPDPRRDRR